MSTAVVSDVIPAPVVPRVPVVGGGTFPVHRIYCVGRNFAEILRVLDALQVGDARRVATPADWQPGCDVIIPPSVGADQAATPLPQGWPEHRPYPRTLTL